MSTVIRESQRPVYAPGENDLGPLAWVLEDLRKTLEAATKCLRRHLRESEAFQATGSPIDPAHLAQASHQLHQCTGALAMIEQAAVAGLLQAMETAVQRFASGQAPCTEAAIAQIEQAGFAVADYLQAVLAGKPVSAVELFPQYRDVQILAGSDRVHPADLWTPAWQWAVPALPADAAPLAYGPALRSRFDQAVLKIVKAGDPVAARELHGLGLGLAAGSTGALQRAFWGLAAAYFEALALGLVPTDLYAKRIASRMLTQYAALARGEAEPQARLAQDLLFYCARAQLPAGTQADTLAAVRTAHGVAQAAPVDYEQRRFGRFNPTQLAQARRRIAAVAETWSALAGGDAHRVKAAQEQFGQVAEALDRLHPDSRALTQALNRMADTTVRAGGAPPPPLAMEVATAVLYLEAAYADLDQSDAHMRARAELLAGRLDHVLQGGTPEPLQGWMEELYHRVSDRQTMGNVVDELGKTLAEVEQALEQFFRAPREKAVLGKVVGQLTQMRGVLSVLGLEKAAHAVLRMRETVDGYMVDVLDDAHARNASFDRLGSSLGALGFLIGMLGYQRALAQQLFAYDEDEHVFRLVVGQQPGGPPIPQGNDFGVDIPIDLASALLPLADATPQADTVLAPDWEFTLEPEEATQPAEQAEPAEPEPEPEPERADFAPTAFMAEPAAPASWTPRGTASGVIDIFSPAPPAPPDLHAATQRLPLSELDAAPEAPTPAEAEALAPLPGPAPDDLVKQVGPLRIGLPLFNVYLNEADEWSRQLQTDLGEWALQRDAPLADDTVALAHSLAGSSATVGFDALSQLARTLELALDHLQQQGLPHDASAQPLLDAAEDIRRLLHQFAAGFLKEPLAHILPALQALLDTAPGADAVAGPAATDDEAMAFFDFDAEPRTPAPTEAAPPAAEPHDALELAQAQDAQLAHEDRIDAAMATAVIGSTAFDEDIDAVDVIDPDLFPIFEEEAIELLPRLSGALRQWHAAPHDTQARGDALRALHTLKGSARLAGALRLGELAHRLESAAERLDVEAADAARIEPLLTHFDALQADLDVLSAVAQRGLHEAPAEPADAQAIASPARPLPVPQALAPRPVSSQSVRVRSQLLDRLVGQAGEVLITRARMEARLGQLRGALGDLTGNLDRLRRHLRDLDIQAESQMQSRLAQSRDTAQAFDPLEFDRFTRVQELTRMMAESVADVAAVQRTLQRTIEGSEDDLVAQGRQARELQRDLLRTRMVEFESIAERLYGVVRQSSKDLTRQVRLDITGGSIELDRGVLERMAPVFEHLLRNAVVHGIEDAQTRIDAGKPTAGTITIAVTHEANDIAVTVRDDGRGLDLPRIQSKAMSLGLLPTGGMLSATEAADLVFLPGFTTSQQVTELAGRGIGMDVVRSEVQGLGGRIETRSDTGQGTRFKIVLPLTTAVTQVVLLRAGSHTIGVPTDLVEAVRRVPARELAECYQSESFTEAGEPLSFYWAGALLQSSGASLETRERHANVLVLRSAAQRLALHVDEVLGNQEVVVKNLGPQLSRLPGLAGMSVLASGAVVLLYNPVALAAVYGVPARQAQRDQSLRSGDGGHAPVLPTAPTPLVLVVDDSITVRRVTQRLLQREGYRVALAGDGLQALEMLQAERPAIVLSDIEMPRMDGFDLARNIRADAAMAALPIVMITSRMAEKHREHALGVGVNHYLGKPYSEEELLSLVRRYAAADAAD